MDSEDCNHLVRRAQAGDAAAFEAVLEAHYALIYRFAFRWVGRRPAAEDIAQQCCIKLADVLDQFRFESAFSSWLYRLVINCAKDWVRRERRHLHDDEAQIVMHGDTQRAEHQIYLEQVLDQIDAMAQDYKETVLLVLGEGLTHAEAARVLKVKEPTVSWRLHDIRKRLAVIHGELAV